jgi:polysaccharide deacetylase family sporulation protein PdaB
MRIVIIKKKVAAAVCAALLLIVFCLPFCVNKAAPTAAQGKELPIYSVDKAEKEIAVTFDSAWGNEDLGDVIAALEQYDCKATFFVVGDFLDKYPEDVKNLAARGHEIANHSDNHAHYNALSREKMILDMDSCDSKIKAITGKDNRVFRAPYGEYNSLLVRTCTETGRYCIQWDVDSLDWKGLTPDQMERRIFAKAQAGSILLFHNGTKHTAAALPQILSRLKNEGYTFKTVSELIYTEGYTIDNTGKQIKIVN